MTSSFYCPVTVESVIVWNHNLKRNLNLQFDELQMFKDLPGQSGQHWILGQISARRKRNWNVKGNKETSEPDGQKLNPWQKHPHWNSHYVTRPQAHTKLSHYYCLKSLLLYLFLFLFFVLILLTSVNFPTLLHIHLCKHCIFFFTILKILIIHKLTQTINNQYRWPAELFAFALSCFQVGMQWIQTVRSVLMDSYALWWRVAQDWRLIVSTHM